MKNLSKITYRAARILAALIMFQTLFFKFTAAEESVYIFTTVGMEPWGRIGIGILELIAAMLLLVPKTAFLGAFLGLGLMMGAIVMHFTRLGIVVQGDGGYLFSLAVIVALCSAYVLYVNTNRIISIFTIIRQRVS
ncbi:MAG: DoxX family protein [Marivirga sp.]|nr:DoxX family protein [Marivirga sp.]